MLLELGFLSFNTLIHNCKVSFADRVAVCDNAVVRCVVYPSLSVCLFCSFACFLLASSDNLPVPFNYLPRILSDYT